MGKRQTMRSIYINTPLFSGVVYDILREVVLTRAAALPDLIPPYLLFRPYTWVSLPADIWNSNTGSSRSTLLFQIYYKQLHLLCRDSEGKRTETLWIFPLPFGKAAKTWEIRWTALCRGSASVVRDTAEMLLPEKGVWKLIKFLSMSYISLEVYTIFEILPKTVISQYIEFFCLRLFQKFVDYSFASNINLQDRTHSYSSYKYTSASTGHWCGSFLFHQDYMLKIG